MEENNTSLQEILIMIKSGYGKGRIYQAELGFIMKKLIVLLLLLLFIAGCSLMTARYNEQYEWSISGISYMKTEGDYIILETSWYEISIIDGQSIGLSPDILYKINIDYDKFDRTHLKIDKNSAVIGADRTIYKISLNEDADPEISSQVDLTKRV